MTRYIYVLEYFQIDEQHHKAAWDVTTDTLRKIIRYDYKQKTDILKPVTYLYIRFILLYKKIRQKFG